jgi:hypothetical protein
VATRPTARWRSEIQEEAAALAAGRLSPDDAAAAELWSEYLLTQTDLVLDGFDTAVQRLANPTDDQIMAVVRAVIIGLNRVNANLEDRNETPYETEERDDLCAYIDESLEEAGIDLDDLAARTGIGRYEFTDQWRQW